MKTQLPMWARLTLIGAAGAATPYAVNRMVVDAPVHFGVVGEAPKDALGWDCKPEGGLYGAPLVCRYRQLDADAGTDVAQSTEMKQ